MAEPFTWGGWAGLPVARLVANEPLLSTAGAWRACSHLNQLDLSFALAAAVAPSIGGIEYTRAATGLEGDAAGWPDPVPKSDFPRRRSGARAAGWSGRLPLVAAESPPSRSGPNGGKMHYAG